MKLYKVSCNFRENFGLGLFSIASHVLTELYNYEKIRDSNDEVFLDVSNYDYGDAEKQYSIWGSYWLPVGVSRIDMEKYDSVVDSRPESIWGNFSQEPINGEYERYRPIAKKYFKLLSNIKKDVDNFVHSNLDGKKTLAVHYRGTDKSEESRRTAEKDVFEEVRRLVRKENYDQVYVCTDEEKAMQYFESNISAIGIPVIKSNSFRVTEGVHTHAIFSVNRDSYMKGINERSMVGGIDKNLTNYKKGYDVIFDTYTMAQCHGLLRGRSNVSDWAHLLSTSQKNWFI